MKILTLSGYKGGVGKSTTALHLAAFLAEKGRTVLVDGDPNRTSLSWSKRGHLSFQVVDKNIAPQSMLSKIDYLVIDTPARPQSKEMQELADGCDLLILPTIPDVQSLEPTLMTAKDLGSAAHRILLTMVPPLPNLEGKIMHRDLKASGIPVFNTRIRRSTAFSKAGLSGCLVNQTKTPGGRRAWQDYCKLGNEVMEILK